MADWRRVVHMTSTPPTAAAVSGVLASIGDPEGTRTVTSIVALLVALGVGLLLVAVWLYRTTRPDPELLAPLEAMGERKWRRGDPVWQRRRLDELRPQGAEPLAPSAAPPEFDASFDIGPEAPGFDDLRASREVPVVVVDADAEDAPAEATSDGAPDSTVVEPLPPVPTGATPVDLPRPDMDLADDEFDPDALAAARAELDRELAGAADQRQLEPSEQDGTA